MKKLDTHYYDGKIKIDTKIEKINPLERKRGIDILSSYLEKAPGWNQKSFIALNAIKSGAGNFDSTGGDPPGSGWSADDILYALYKVAEKKKFDTDLLIQINQQLEEMTGGMCPQGRCTRLIQVLYSV